MSGTTKRTLVIEGMHCGSCVATITEALGEVPGVTQVQVDLASGRAEVQADESVSAGALVTVVAAAGDFRAREA